MLERTHPPRRDEAVRYYTASRALRPETAHELAHALEDRRETDEAITVFRYLNRLRPKNGRHLGCLGRTLQSRGRVEVARAALDAGVTALLGSIRLKPADASAHSNLGLALREQGKLDEAIRLKLADAWAHCNLGHLLRSQGKYVEALAELRTRHALGSKRPG